MDFVVSIPDDRLTFIKQLFDELKLPLKPIEAAALTIAHQRLSDELTESLREIELHQRGKIKLKTAEEFLEELRNDNQEDED